MESIKPEIICVIKQIPKIDPKFHQILILIGVGRLINELLIILKIWLYLNNDLFIKV